MVTNEHVCGQLQKIMSLENSPFHPGKWIGDCPFCTPLTPAVTGLCLTAEARITGLRAYSLRLSSALELKTLL